MMTEQYAHINLVWKMKKQERNRNAVFSIERERKNVIVVSKNQTIEQHFCVEITIIIMRGKIRHKISIDSHLNDDNIV